MSDLIEGGNRGALSHTSSVEGQKGVAEVQARMAIAKRFPRDTVRAMDAIKNSCARKGLAEKAVYVYARGGQDVSGPSIRLAEAMAQQWGNLDYGILERESTAEGSLVEAYCWDMETNVRVSKVFTVPHVRHTRNGSKQLTDPRDVYENMANNAARRLRACILGVIPGDVTEAAVEWCNATLKASCDVGPEPQKRMLETFKATRRHWRCWESPRPLRSLLRRLRRPPSGSWQSDHHPPPDRQSGRQPDWPLGLLAVVRAVGQRAGRVVG